MLLRTLLEDGSLGLRLLSGEDGLDRRVRGVMTTDLRDPGRYLRGGELVLTGLAWWRGPEDAEPFVRVLVRAGVAALAAGDAEFGSVPGELTAACARLGLPLLAVAEEVGFTEITEYVVRSGSGDGARLLDAVLDRHRRLTAAGGGPRAVLDLLASDHGLPAWLLTATGGHVAGPAHHRAPPGDVAAALARHRLDAVRAGRPGPWETRVDGVPWTVLPVGGAEGGGQGGPGVRETLLSGRLLAARTDGGDDDGAAQRRLLARIAHALAAEQDRHEAARAVGRRLAGETVDLVTGGAPPAEVAARLRMAAPPEGRDAAGPLWQVVVARLEWADAAPGAGRAARAVLEDLLPGTAAVTHGEVGREDADEAVALVPVQEAGPLRAGELPGPGAREVLSAGLGDDGRLTFGVSRAVPSAEGLRGALEEARHARRVAAARQDAVAAAGHEELASHVLLLPFVPDEVRRAFTARLLEPLRAYDREHRADLMRTLEAFLESDGSWTRCAARLHVHVNTLRYRVRRIERLTGRELTRLEDTVDFFLALRLR
ncbi:PucR family transcriptional regulator [Streptomyces avicenniae]|uniref:PucR family transcriptional regulator n=1 Tax=Streptomyces avicenniae TaxID=500153 RepID=UPI00069C7C24|nr:PucR family transcriptional regulator ligand-binding domain-containing protein [Streptomyces avicenniae]